MFDGDPSVAQALAGGALERVGWYRFHFAGGRWEWSPEVEQIHGHQLGTVQDETRDVVVVGGRLYHDTGKVIGTQGFYVKRGLPRTSASAPPELPGMRDD